MGIDMQAGKKGKKKFYKKSNTIIHFSTRFKPKKRNKCFCGNSYGSHGLDTNCNIPCSGNSIQICGGANSNSIYQTECPTSACMNLDYYFF
jgi:hypothetical protein